MKNTTCTVCNSHSLETVLHFGRQPPANRFISKAQLEDGEDTFSLGIGFCAECQTVQLSNRMPMKEMQPRFSWLAYNEPEQHLDDVAEKLSKLPGIGPSSKLLGVTYKDQSTLDRLEKLGLQKSSCLTFEDFNIFRSPHLDPKAKEKFGQVDLLLARHVVEHAPSVTALVDQLKELIAPGGYLVIELPDCEKVLKAGNHAFIWEEHISYFTDRSLALIAKHLGAKLAWSARYSYNFEDSLMAAFQFTEVSHTHQALSPYLDVAGLLEKFRNDFIASKEEWRKTLESYRSEGHKIAVFGAGHLSVKLINFLEIADLIECVIDDNVNKAGMYMPGSKLPILPSSTLKERNIKVCISTLSPESELKVRQKFSSYFEAGGVFLPAFKTIRL